MCDLILVVSEGPLAKLLTETCLICRKANRPAPWEGPCPVSSAVRWSAQGTWTGGPCWEFLPPRPWARPLNSESEMSTDHTLALAPWGVPESLPAGGGVGPWAQAPQVSALKSKPSSSTACHWAQLLSTDSSLCGPASLGSHAQQKSGLVAALVPDPQPGACPS